MEKYLKIIRYLIAGGTAACVNLAILYIFTHYFNLWYLLSSVIAFLLAFCVSFGLQKFWTFKDHVTDDLHKQGGVYLLITLINLGINTLLMYMFVDHFGLHYLPAQVLTGGLLAVVSYYAYGKFVFNRK